MLAFGVYSLILGMLNLSGNKNLDFVTLLYRKVISYFAKYIDEPQKTVGEDETNYRAFAFFYIWGGIGLILLAFLALRKLLFNVPF
jgi:hypothetical protein